MEKKIYSLIINYLSILPKFQQLILIKLQPEAVIALWDEDVPRFSEILDEAASARPDRARKEGEYWKIVLKEKADPYDWEKVVLDDVVAPLGGQVLRLEADQVLGELEAAEAAAIAADREAARVLHEERRQERKQKWEDRVDSLRERLRRKK